MHKIAMIAALLLGLTACGGAFNPPPDPDKGPIVKVGGRDYVQVITIDGTRCAVITGNRSDGIDCEWTSR